MDQKLDEMQELFYGKSLSCELHHCRGLAISLMYTIKCCTTFIPAAFSTPVHFSSRTKPP